MARSTAKLPESATGSARRDPNHAAVLADLNRELHGLPLGIPVGVLGKGEEHRLPRLPLRHRRPGPVRKPTHANPNSGRSLKGDLIFWLRPVNAG